MPQDLHSLAYNNDGICSFARLVLSPYITTFGDSNLTVQMETVNKKHPISDIESHLPQYQWQIRSDPVSHHYSAMISNNKVFLLTIA
jgi:hypothetical protein